MRFKQRATEKTGALKPANLAVTRSNMDRHPKFSLKHLCKDYSLDKCDKDEKSAFADKLHRLSQQVWAQIFQGARHGGGFEKLGLGKDFSWIPCTFDEKRIIAFRFSAMKAMVGFLDNEVLYILGLDRSFTAYKH